MPLKYSVSLVVIYSSGIETSFSFPSKLSLIEGDEGINQIFSRLIESPLMIQPSLPVLKPKTPSIYIGIFLPSFTRSNLFNEREASKPLEKSPVKSILGLVALKDLFCKSTLKSKGLFVPMVVRTASPTISLSLNVILPSNDVSSKAFTSNKKL